MRFNQINVLILITGPGLTLIAFLLDYFLTPVNLTSEFSRGVPWIYQVAGASLITPVIALATISLLTRLRIFREVNELSRSFFRNLKPSIAQIAGLSLAAGVGEELLFRGVIQPVTGVLFTSFLFAGLHTGFRFGNRALLTYSMTVFLLSMVLGWIAFSLGLPAAMTAHGFWDFAVLARLHFEHSREHEVEAS